MDGREDLAPKAKIESRKGQLFERLSDDTAKAIIPVTDLLPESYWLGFSMAKMVLHAKFFESLLKSGHDPKTDTAIKVRVNRRRNTTELWVMTRNRAGLFRDLSLAITASGASITGAHLNTGEGGLVINTFYLLGPDGEAFSAKTPHVLDNLRETAYRAAIGDTENLIVPQGLKSRRAGAIPVKARVKFPKTEHADTSIVEVQGRDRPGLLHELSDFLTASGLDISSAHIEVVGAMAVDVFYVRSAALDKARKTALRAGLMDILRVPEEKTKAA